MGTLKKELKSLVRSKQVKMYFWRHMIKKDLLPPNAPANFVYEVDEVKVKKLAAKEKRVALWKQWEAEAKGQQFRGEDEERPKQPGVIEIDAKFKEIGTCTLVVVLHLRLLTVSLPFRPEGKMRKARPRVTVQ